MDIYDNKYRYEKVIEQIKKMDISERNFEVLMKFKDAMFLNGISIPIRHSFI